MLPTLNLQLSPVEPPEGTYPASPMPLPGGHGEVRAVFADLLRLRVGTVPTAENAGGELLPQGGSDLPDFADFAPADLATAILPDGKPEARPVQVGGVADIAEGAINGELPDLVLEAPVAYPMLTPTATPATESSPLAVSATALPGMPATPALTNRIGAAPAANNVLPGSVNADSGLDRGPNAAAQVAPARITLAAAEAGPLRNVENVPVAVPAGLGLRDRGHLPEPPSRTAAIPLPQAVGDPFERLRRIELTRPPGLAALPQRDGLPEPGLEILQPRAASPQPGQAPISTPAAQLLHVPLTQALPSGATIDVNYPGAAQQTGELIGTSVRDSAWGSQLGERVVMMASNQLKSAEIRLTPAELGPLRVQVAVDDGAAHVTFHAQHVVTREAIEQALPRLREMLAENGLSLGQADVSDRGVGEGNRDGGSDGQVSGMAADDSNEAVAEVDGQATRSRTVSNGLVDTFA